jgi:hypothetical protein
MEYTQGKYLKYRRGKNIATSLIDAIHAKPPMGELMVGEIADLVSERTGCHCIIGLVSRTRADLNRERSMSNRAAIDEYRATIRDLLGGSGLLGRDHELIRPFLHLGLHGMADRPDNHLEIGTVFGRSCSATVERLVHEICLRWSRDLKISDPQPIVRINEMWYGDPSIASHRTGHKASGYRGYGDNYNMIQIEIARFLRIEYTGETVELLCRLIRSFNEVIDSNNLHPC